MSISMSMVYTNNMKTYHRAPLALVRFNEIPMTTKRIMTKRKLISNVRNSFI